MTGTTSNSRVNTGSTVVDAMTDMQVDVQDGEQQVRIFVE